MIVRAAVRCSLWFAAAGAVAVGCGNGSEQTRRDARPLDAQATDLPRLDAAAPDLPGDPDAPATDSDLAVDAPATDLVAADAQVDAVAPDSGIRPSDRCASPLPLPLVDGQATVMGSTLGLRDEFDTLKCGYYEPLAAPQAYYAVEMTAGKAYEFVLAAQFPAHLYLFAETAACQPAAIESACGSEGIEGDAAHPDSSGDGPRWIRLSFAPTTSGSYIVAVDSVDSVGSFALHVREVDPPANIRCSAAQPITLVDGKGSAPGRTVDLPSEFAALTCGGGWAVAPDRTVFFSVELAAGQAYLFSLPESTYYVADLILFSADAACDQIEVEQDCASQGATGAVGAPPLVFVPTVDGTYYVAVSTGYAAWGPFTLEVEESTPPENDTCAGAALVELVDGKATVSGSTLGAADEFPALSCDYVALDGPQVYYHVDLEEAQRYRLTLASDYDADLVLFSADANCDPAQIAADCASQGQTGDYAESRPGPPLPNGDWLSYAELVFQPAQAGTYLLAVEGGGYSIFRAGDFTLSIEAIEPPANATCATASPVTLVDGRATVEGSTTGADDEFPSLICSTQSSAGWLEGSQVYYSLEMTAGRAYTVAVKARFNAQLYLFSEQANCELTKIAADCGGQTGRGAASGYGGPIVAFVPPESGRYLIAVDANEWGGSGPFSLEIEEVTPQQNGTCAGAETVTLQDGKAMIAGNTAGLPDDLSVTCRGSQLDGPQAYYALFFDAQVYRMTLRPEFEAFAYAFPQSNGCNPYAIGTCTPDLWASAGWSGSAFFAPPAPGSYIVAVDSNHPVLGGAFELEIEQMPALQPPTNTRCASPAVVALTSSPTRIFGHTSLSTNEAPAQTCGTDLPWNGPQLYYRVSLEANHIYDLFLENDFSAQLGAFPADTPCELFALDDACGQLLFDPSVTVPIAPGIATRVTPEVDQDWIVVVDSIVKNDPYNPDAGPFLLTIAWEEPPD